MMEEFDKAKVLDNIISILSKAGDGGSVSHTVMVYTEAMDFLEKLAQTQFDLGYMKAVEIGNNINSN
jgi:hypothetical protein